jgi:hypothetical protein
MNGANKASAEDKKPTDAYQVFRAEKGPLLKGLKGSWHPAKNPLSVNSQGVSPVDGFARTLKGKVGEDVKIGVIVVAVSGCKIQLFDKDVYQDHIQKQKWFKDQVARVGGNPYEHLTHMAKEAQKDGVIKGILLHQGESNAGDKKWPERVKKIYGDLVTDLGLDAEKTPLLAGEVLSKGQGGKCAGFNKILAGLPKVVPNSYVISSEGCTQKGDGLHFDVAGANELGKRYAEVVAKVVYGVE